MERWGAWLSLRCCLQEAHERRERYDTLLGLTTAPRGSAGNRFFPAAAEAARSRGLVPAASGQPRLPLRRPATSASGSSSSSSSGASEVSESPSVAALLMRGQDLTGRAVEVVRVRRAAGRKGGRVHAPCCCSGGGGGGVWRVRGQGRTPGVECTGLAFTPCTPQLTGFLLCALPPRTRTRPHPATPPQPRTPFQAAPGLVSPGKGRGPASGFPYGGGRPASSAAGSDGGGGDGVAEASLAGSALGIRPSEAAAGRRQHGVSYGTPAAGPARATAGNKLFSGFPQQQQQQQQAAPRPPSPALLARAGGSAAPTPLTASIPPMPRRIDFGMMPSGGGPSRQAAAGGGGAYGRGGGAGMQYGAPAASGRPYPYPIAASASDYGRGYDDDDDDGGTASTTSSELRGPAAYRSGGGGSSYAYGPGAGAASGREAAWGPPQPGARGGGGTVAVGGPGGRVATLAGSGSGSVLEDRMRRAAGILGGRMH